MVSAKHRWHPFSQSYLAVPYAFLVAALGAIVSSAVALFVVRSWSAMAIAPMVGAVLGFAVGVLTLRLRGLPLSAGMVEYEAAGRGGSLEAGAPLYANVALNFSVVISIIEAPILFINKASAPIVLLVGWVITAICLFYGVWRLNAESALNNDLDVFKIVAGPAVIGIAGAVMYFAYTSLFSPAADDPLTLIKFGFIANPFVAFGTAAVAILGLGTVSFLAGFIDSQKYQ
jgi:hypothetical protein